MYNTGIDIGSTTAKLVIINKAGKVIFSEYVRHNTEIYKTLRYTLEKTKKVLGDIIINPIVTGSVGMGVSEKLNIPFIQEIICSSEAILKKYPETELFIDIGGEDSKLIFYKERGLPDLRMNGNCAGGTGAFIDQMASLLNVSPEELDDLALLGKQVHPVASRCGVFAKTDIQELLIKQIPLPDIALSVFDAMAVQTVNTLMQGIKLKNKVLYSGGPLMFMKNMQKAMTRTLNINDDDIIIPEQGKTFAAYGAALSNKNDKPGILLSDLMNQVEHHDKNKNTPTAKNELKPLFANKKEYTAWQNIKRPGNYFADNFETANNKNLFIGIDAGSTTTKLIAVNDEKKIVFSHYTKNNGNILKAVKEALQCLYNDLSEKNIAATIKYTMVTGYGEEFIKTAFGFDEGMVETIAHYKAAAHFNPDVSFILDIGGQDIKAIFLENGHITNIEINEACSSGCGSFIETFAQSLGMTVQEFAEKACMAKAPYNLGTRCTVFMNSKLKQAMREGAGIEDISAGLAYSVIMNCFNKMLKINDVDCLGDNIIATGGTFLNPAVLRALELHLGKNISCPDIRAQMGAFGCALAAVERTAKSKQTNSSFIGFQKIKNTCKQTVKTFICNGCGNKCHIRETCFAAGKSYYSGNRCEKIYSNSGKQISKGQNIFKIKTDLLFKQSQKPPTQPILTIGIPRVLNMYENFPFWYKLFSVLNIRVCLSSASADIDPHLAHGTIMSDNICYPAKLVHAHIVDLINKEVDRIFFPLVKYEKATTRNAVNNYNCPVVTGYPDVIRNTIDPGQYGIPYDTPPVSFNNNKLLQKACYKYLRQFGIKKNAFINAFAKALEYQQEFKNTLINKGHSIIQKATEDKRQVIMLVGRPYHADPAINHNIPTVISDMGIDVISEDVVPDDHVTDFHSDVRVISQWQYSNQVYNALEWAGKQNNVHVIQLNSFGCGPDAIVVDEAKAILKKYNKTYTQVRIDEGNNIAPIKLRIRSLIELLKYNEKTEKQPVINQRETLPPFLNIDKNKLIIGPNLSQKYALFTESIFFHGGYKFEMLPEADRQSVITGLKYVNNDICYPAIILIGDIIKALQSGKYDLDNIVVAMSETGGQCRASNYIPLIKNALLNAGFKNIPVISVSTNPATINHQPGFKKNFFELLALSLNTIIYTDALLKIYNWLIVREKNKGTTQKIYDKYIQFASQNRRRYFIKNSLTLLKQAVDEFNNIEYHDISLPRAGIVGEIFIKYNSYGNFNLENWLREHGVEVATSPLNSFFLEALVDARYNNNHYIEKTSWVELCFHHIIEKKVGHYINEVNKALSGFHHKPDRIYNIREISDRAEKAGSLIHQYGEGWLLPGEIMMFAEEGINNIISVQPFGCIACHIVSKGFSQRMKKLYPDMNMLFMDMDADTSIANMHNRLEFFIKNAQSNTLKNIQLC